MALIAVTKNRNGHKVEHHQRYSQMMWVIARAHLYGQSQKFNLFKCRFSQNTKSIYYTTRVTFLMLGNYKAWRCCFYHLDDWHKSGIRKEAEWFGDESVFFSVVCCHMQHIYTYLYPNGNRNKESHSKFRSADMLIWPCGLLRKDTNGPINWLACARISAEAVGRNWIIP